MNGSGADAFAGGFARGFGMVNDFYDRKDKKEYRNKLLGMQEAQHELAMRKGEMEVSKLELAERGQVIGAVHELWQKAKTPEERKSIETMFIDTINQVYPQEIGAGKKITSIQSAASMMGPDQQAPGAEDKVLIGVSTQQPDGTEAPGFVSQNRSADPKDPYMAISMNDMVDFLITNPKGGTFGDRLRAAASAAGYKMPERYGEIKREGSYLYQENLSGGKHHGMGRDGVAEQNAKNAAAGVNGAFKHTDKRGYEEAVRKAALDMYGGKLNDDGIAIFDSEDNKVQYTQAVELADQLLKESAYTLSAPALVGIVYREGRQLTEKELWTEAEAQLTQEGVTSWFGGPNDDMIRNRVEKLKAESKDAATRVREYLGMTGSDSTSKPEQEPTTKSDKKPAEGGNDQYTDFYQLSPVQQQTIVRNASKNPVQQERFIRTFGQQTWDAEMKKVQGQGEPEPKPDSKPKPKPKPKPEPKPAAGVKSATPQYKSRMEAMGAAGKDSGSRFIKPLLDDIRKKNRELMGLGGANPDSVNAFREAHGRYPRSPGELEHFLKQ